MIKAFVTGISGLLGTNLAHDLLTHGFQVKGLVRYKSKYKGKHHDHLELIEGGLDSDLADLLQGVDIFIHVAAETRPELTSYNDYLQVNYKGTVSVFDAAVNCGIKKFVFVSTANTLGYGDLNDPGDENMRISFPFDRSFYAKSKLEAENYVLSQKHKIEVLVVNPTFMLGAYDTKPSSGRIVQMAWKRRIILFPPGGKNFVHVKDVSQGIIGALSKGRNGEKYLLANENLSYRDFFKRLNRVTNQNPMMIPVPKMVWIFLGYIGDLLRLLKIKTSISSTNMRILCVKNFYSNLKSKKELGMEYRPIDQAIKDAVEYFDRSG